MTPAKNDNRRCYLVAKSFHERNFPVSSSEVSDEKADIKCFRFRIDFNGRQLEDEQLKIKSTNVWLPQANEFAGR